MLDYFNWQHCRMWDACTDLNASLITTRGRLALNESWTSNTKQQIQTYQDKYISPQLPKHLDINYQHAVWTQHTIPHIYTPALGLCLTGLVFHTLGALKVMWLKWSVYTPDVPAHTQCIHDYTYLLQCCEETTTFNSRVMAKDITH